MRIACLLLPLLVLLYKPWQCWTDGESGDHDMQTTNSTSSSIIPRCKPEQNLSNDHDACRFYHSPTNYKIDTLNEHQILFDLVSASTHNTNNKCKQFFVFTLCFYLFRSCELRNVSDPTSGFQLPICRDKCTGVDKLHQECYNKEDVQTAINGSSQEKAVSDLISLAERFMCSDNVTYIIPQVPVSNRSCDDISDIDHLLPSENIAVSVSVGVGVGIPLLILIMAGLALVVAVSKLKKTFQRRLTERGPEGIVLSSGERRYYTERFGQCMVEFAQINVSQTVGEGSFGVVCKATLVNTDNQPVAVKMARHLVSKQELLSLLNESLLMKQFDHPNIVGFLGVCLDTPDGYPYLILSYMANGNIRDYLKDKRVQPTNLAVLPDGFSTKTLVTMCVDVAKGMEYLSCNKFVHRDLAARNCMLDEEGVVRVGDFGLARDVYSHLYYRADKHSQIPVKWSAPEVLNDGLCTEKSDVWSYGVVCWEVFSLGSTPYPGLDNCDIPQFIMSGRRLEKPPLCPQNMYVIMESCWKLTPKERPHFKQLVSSITAL